MFQAEHTAVRRFCLSSSDLPTEMKAQGQRTLKYGKSREFRKNLSDESAVEAAGRSVFPWKPGGFNVRWPWLKAAPISEIISDILRLGGSLASPCSFIA